MDLLQRKLFVLRYTPRFATCSNENQGTEAEMVLRHHKLSITNALESLYPEVKFNKAKFSKPPSMGTVRERSLLISLQENIGRMKRIESSFLCNLLKSTGLTLQWLQTGTVFIEKILKTPRQLPLINQLQITQLGVEYVEYLLRSKLQKGTISILS